MNSNDTIPTSIIDTSAYDFCRIDGNDIGLPDFFVSMLKLGRILTAKVETKMDLSAYRVSQLMDKHRAEISRRYNPMEIREQLWTHPGEIRGGGIKVEYFELPNPHRLSHPPHFSINFSRILRPEDYQPPKVLDEPV